MVIVEGDVIMRMEDSELREHAKKIYNVEKVLLDAINSEPEYAGSIIKCNDANAEIISLLDKSNDINFLIKQWSKVANETHADKDTEDRIKLAVDITMERIQTWFGSGELVKELQNEFEIAYDKFMKLRKKYYGSPGSELVKTNRENEWSDLIKAEIGKDITDYVKYGINISLQCVLGWGPRARWVRKIAVHFEWLARRLGGLDVQKEDDVRKLAEGVFLYKQCMLEYGNDSGRGSGQVNSKAYLMLVQKGGVPFSDFIERKKNEIGFEGEFDRLKDSQQLEVYQCIINEFGGENTSNIQFADFIFGED